MVHAQAGAGARAPRYNLTPTQPVPAVLNDGARQLVEARWGLIGPRGAPLINARAETLDAKPTFARLVREHRCVVLADAFYEWGVRSDGRSKQPWLFYRRDRAPFALAALWTRERAVDGAEVPACVLVTTSANTLMAPVHDRMPVLLTDPACERWLDPAPARADAFRELLAPCYPAALAAHPVGPWVNRVAIDDPRCIEPVPLPPETPELFPLQS